MTHEIESTSPSGRFQVQADAWEARMSQWVYPFDLVELASNNILLRFADPCWSLDVAEWTADDVVCLKLRKYPGDRRGEGIRVSLDCVGQTAILDGKSWRFDQLEAALEAALDQAPPLG